MAPTQPRRRLEDQELLRDDESESDSDEEKGPLFPMLSTRSTIEFLQPLSAAALVGITTINMLSSQGHDPTAPGVAHKDLRTFLVSTPYTLLPVGIMGLAFAMVATKRCRFPGFAAGFLLFELMYVVFVGGLVSIARSDVSGKIVWPVTLVILIAMVVTWSLMCTYPKFLRFSGCCADRKAPSCTKKRCDLCGAWTTDGSSLVPAAAGEIKCQSCGGAASDIESQVPLVHTGMSRGETASTKSEKDHYR